MNQVFIDSRTQDQRVSKQQQQYMESFEKVLSAIRNFVNRPVELPQSLNPITQEEFHEILAFFLENSQQTSTLNNYSKTLDILHSQLLAFIRRSYTKLQKTREQQIKFCIRWAIKDKAAQLMDQYQIKLKSVANTRLIFQYLNINRNFKKDFIKRKCYKLLLESQAFRQDFEKFLEKFEIMAKQINQRKIVLLISKINFPMDQSIFKITTRMPWTNHQIEEAIQLCKCELQQYDDIKFNQNSTLNQ